MYGTMSLSACTWHVLLVYCYDSGNILSALLISSLLPYGFELAMMACSFLMFTGGILVFFTLPEHPDKFGEISLLNVIYCHQPVHTIGITVEDFDESQGRNSKITGG